MNFKAIVLLAGCFVASTAIAGNSLPTVDRIEKTVTGCVKHLDKEFCNYDNSKMTLQLSYGGCDSGKLVLDVELGPIVKVDDYGDGKVQVKVVNKLKFFVRNESPSGCEMAIMAPFEVTGEAIMKLAKNKLNALDPKAKLRIYDGITLGNPISLYFN